MLFSYLLRGNALLRTFNFYFEHTPPSPHVYSDAQKFRHPPFPDIRVTGREYGRLLFVRSPKPKVLEKAEEWAGSPVFAFDTKKKREDT